MSNFQILHGMHIPKQVCVAHTLSVPMLCPCNLLTLAMPLLLTMPIGRPRPSFQLTAEVNCSESAVSPLVHVNLVGYQAINLVANFRMD